MKYLGLLLWSVVSALFLFVVMQYGRVYVDGSMISVSLLAMDKVFYGSEDFSAEQRFVLTPYLAGKAVVENKYFVMKENDDGFYILINE